MKYQIRHDAAVKARLYNGSKYKPETKTITEFTYKPGRIVSFEIVTRPDEVILSAGFDDVDPNREYLILTLDDGETATFRNSLVDIFLV